MSLKNILFEFKQRGVLYHFTSYGKVWEILKQNRLKATQGGWVGDNKKSISLTRSYALDSFGSVRLALDGDDLSNNYKIEPVLYQGTGYAGAEDDAEFARKQYGKEQEERVVGKDITNLKRYLIQIDIFVEKDYDPVGTSQLEKKAKKVQKNITDKFPSVTVNLVDKWEPVKK